MSASLPAVRSWPGRPVVGLLVATVGYGLTFWAWTLVGPFGWGPQWRVGAGGTGGGSNGDGFTGPRRDHAGNSTMSCGFTKLATRRNGRSAAGRDKAGNQCGK